MPAALEADGMSRHARKSVGKRPKAKLGLPDLDHSKSAVLDSLRSRESKRGYRHAIDEFIQWYCSEPRLSFSKVVVTRFRIFLENRNLAAGTIDGRLAAVRRLAYEARRRWPAQSGTRSRSSARKRCQEARRSARELAHGRGISSISTGASGRHAQRKARSSHSCGIARLRIAAP